MCRLFGRADGAARNTGAAVTRLFAEAQGGTLWLGEVARLPIDGQVRLLELHAKGMASPVGGIEPRPLDVRVIATGVTNLLDHVRKGDFLHELYYALAVAVVRIPPLRDCPEDLDTMVEYMLDGLTPRNGGIRPSLSPAARRCLREQPWHGNVRELQNVLRRAFIWSREGRIQLDELRDVLDDARGPHASDVLQRPLGESFRIDEVLGEVESHYLVRALGQTGGNKARAAALLGLNSSTTLTNRMEKHGVG